MTTHVLDTARGRPAAGLEVTLAVAEGDPPHRQWRDLATRVTDPDGRVRDFLPPHSPLPAGTYRLTFATGAWQEGFYPEVAVVFAVAEATDHLHVPLLLSPYGYSTYRGS